MKVMFNEVRNLLLLSVCSYCRILNAINLSAAINIWEAFIGPFCCPPCLLESTEASYTSHDLIQTSFIPVPGQSLLLNANVLNQ